MASDSKRQELDQVADQIADMLGVDPADIATEPSAGRISLTASQACRLLAAHPVAGAPGRDLVAEIHAALDRYHATGEMGEFIAAQKAYNDEEARLQRALYELTGKHYEPSER